MTENIQEQVQQLTFDKDKYKLCLATGFYEVKAYAPQFVCMTEAYRVLNALGIEYTYNQLCGDSYVDRCKNSLVHHFLTKTDYTHLMIIDSDETWTLEGFIRLLKASIAGAEIVAGLYPCKNNWEFYGGVPKYSEDGYIMGKEVAGMRLIEMQIAPGGFIIYSRKAFERTRPILDSYLDPDTGEYILETFRCNIEIDEWQRKSSKELKKMTKEQLLQYINLVQQGGRKGKRIGEDIYFQQRYKEMGGLIWCEPNISMGHFGVKEWKGNYQDHLLSQKKEHEESQNLGSTEQETAQMLDNIAKNLKKLKAKK